MKVLSLAYKDLVQASLEPTQLALAPDSTCLIDAGSLLPKDLSSSQAIALMDSASGEALLDYCATSEMSHVIAVKHSQFKALLNGSITLLVQPREYFSHTLKTVLAEGNVSEFHQSVTDSSQKPGAIDWLTAQLAALPSATTVAQNAVTIADELLMNALYSAPNHPPRSLAGGVPAADFFWGHNEQRLALGVTDYYGKLDPFYLIRKMARTYKMGVAQAMNMGPGSAGIGMRLVYENCTSIYLGVCPGKQTTIVCAMPLGRSRRNQLSEQKSIHILINK